MIEAVSRRILDTILQRLATYVEKAVKLKAAVKSALIYPVSVISIACLVVGCLLKFVVRSSPTCSSAWRRFAAATKIVIGLSNFVGRFWWLVLGVWS